MDTFTEALRDTGRNSIIAEEYDYFGGLIGSWAFEWHDRNRPRKVMGEWIFSWVLEGTAVQDVFICPSRATKKENPQPDGEYGTTIRVFNPHTKAWDVAYCCTGKITRLEAKREGENIVLTNLDDPREKWVFSEMTGDSFHWQNVTVRQDGAWHINADLYAKRSI